MAISAAVTVADGVGAASASVTNGGSAAVTSGNSMTIALNSTSGVTSWSLRMDSASVAGLGGFVYETTNAYTVTVVAPQGTGTLNFSSEVSDGQNVVVSKFAIVVSSSLNSMVDRSARGVVTANIASLAAFTVNTNSDGLTYAQGDRVLLVAQTTSSQNGLYVVGAVTASVAALTRPVDYAAGMTLPAGLVIEVSEGTLFDNTSWKVTTSGPVVVDTTSHNLYPRMVTRQLTLASGTSGAKTDIPILSASTSQFLVSRVTPTTASSTVQYNPSAAPTVGIIGTASIVWNAQVAAGTINASDASVINCTIINW